MASVVAFAATAGAVSAAPAANAESPERCVATTMREWMDCDFREPDSKAIFFCPETGQASPFYFPCPSAVTGPNY